jgi:adenylylsulfate kinase-like enzyme
MKLIILRGLSGCGKLTIAKKLGESLDNGVVSVKLILEKI